MGIARKARKEALNCMMTVGPLDRVEGNRIGDRGGRRELPAGGGRIEAKESSIGWDGDSERDVRVPKLRPEIGLELAEILIRKMGA